MDTSLPATNSGVLSPTTTPTSPPVESSYIRTRNPIPGISPNDVNTPIPGWPALAGGVANQPALEAFPSFKDLNVKSLLYYQAELVLLRKQLHKEEYEDYFQGKGSQAYIAKDLNYLVKGVRLRDEKPKQWELIEQIRTVLDKYSKSLHKLQYVKERLLT